MKSLYVLGRGMPKDQWSFTRSGDNWMFKHIYDEQRLGIFVFPGGAYRSIFSAGLTVRAIKSDAAGRYNSLSVFVDDAVAFNYIVIRFDEGVEQTYPMTRAAAVALREYLLTVGGDSDANQLTEVSWSGTRTGTRKRTTSKNRSRLSKKSTA